MMISRRLMQSTAVLAGVPVFAIAVREHSKGSSGALPNRSIDEVLATPLVSTPTRWYRLVRPILFTVDPETAHQSALLVGSIGGYVWSVTAKLGRAFRCFSYALATSIIGPSRIDPPPPTVPGRLTQTVGGVTFNSPIGVAAGFDKNGKLIDFFVNRGICVGHAEVGSFSYLPWAGNPRPRLFRLPEDRAVINRMGLNNEGAVEVANRLSESDLWLKTAPVRVGVNITKTPDAKIEGSEAVADFVRSFQFVRHITNVAWVTLNISCPNTAEGKTFEDVSVLRQLLSQLRDGVPSPTLWLKLAPLAGIGWESKMEDLMNVSSEFGVDTLVIANTVPDRNFALKSDESILRERGGLSGPPIFTRSFPLIQTAYKRGFTVVGVGGVSSGRDAYTLMRNGASLVQLYTAMVYDGPSVFADIHNGLERAMLIDGFTNVKDVIGKDVIV